MKRTAILVGLLMVLGSIPAVSTAEHLSVGARDGPGLDTVADETPNNPSVPGDTEGDKSTPYGVGTSRDCTEPQGDLSPGAAIEATQRDGFCGDLIYHEDREVEAVSPEDQLLNDPITRFDVIRSRSNDYVLTDCLVFCPGQPGSDTAFDVFHNAGSSVGLTDDATTARNKAPADRDQAYGVSPHQPTVSRAVQSQTNIWEMDGWMTPGVEHSFVAFLEGPGGQSLGPEEIQTLVGAKDMHPDTFPTVCAFSPNIEFDPAEAQAQCEIDFNYREPGNGGTSFGTDDEDYEDRCDSPTYLCGPSSGAAWYSGPILFPGYANPTIPGLGFEPFVGDEGQMDQMVWHHFVAPHPSACNGGQEPGASFDSDGASLPFLAHDVDVYTPITDLRGTDANPSQSETSDYVNSVANNAGDEAVDAVNDALDQVPGLPSEVDDAVSTAVNATFTGLKTDRVEPNNADPIGTDVDDTSQGLLPDSDLVRTLGGKCDIFNSQETTETVDPWVDRVDNQVFTYPAGFSTIGLYGNQDTNQDGSNNPTPAAYFSSGNLGMFADANDDGDYDTLTADFKYEGKDIGEAGAYPLFWDMHLNDDGTIDTEAGCTIGSDEKAEQFPKIMDTAGYGAETGLVQAIYLQEPTAFVTLPSVQNVQEEAPVPFFGNNIYLLLSDSARELYVPNSGHTGSLTPTQVNPTSSDVSEGNPLDAEIDNLVTELRAYADQKNGENPAPPVRIPGNELGLQSDFQDQCGEDTGGWTTNGLGWLHQCETGCSGDTIVTMYTFNLDSGVVGGNSNAAGLPTFDGGSPGAYDFGAGQHTWYDVDAFDGDPDRNRDQSSAPPE